MVSAEEYQCKLVVKKEYRVVTRYMDAKGVFIGMGATGGRNDPVFSFDGVAMMLPWQGIDQLLPVE